MGCEHVFSWTSEEPRFRRTLTVACTMSKAGATLKSRARRYRRRKSGSGDSPRASVRSRLAAAMRSRNDPSADRWAGLRLP